MRLKIDGQFVDIIDRNLILERFSPLLDPGEIHASRVFNFVIPSNAKMDRIMDWKNIPQVPFTRKTYTSEIYSDDGGLLDRGSLKLLRVSENGYEVVYTGAFSEIFGDYGVLKLNEIDFGTLPIPETFNASPNIGTDDYCLPTILNNAIYSTSEHSGKMNEYNSGVYAPGSVMVPMFFLTRILAKFTELCGISFTGSFFETTWAERIFFFNTMSLDGKTEIVVKNHLPELTVSECITGLAQFLNLAIFPNPWKKEIRIDLADPYFDSAPSWDWSTRVPKLKYREAANENRLKLAWQLDGNDGLLKEIPEEHSVYLSPAVSYYEGTVKEIISPFSSVLMDESENLPKVSMEVNSPVDSQEGRNFGPRLLFWKGLEAGLPRASDTYEDISLKLHGTNSLPSRLWKKREKFFLKTYRIPVTILLKGYEIGQLDIFRDPDAQVSVYVQGNNYLIGNQRINLGTGLMEVDLYRL